jgi:hypothetical protein
MQLHCCEKLKHDLWGLNESVIKMTGTKWMSYCLYVIFVLARVLNIIRIKTEFMEVIL